jgi:rubrerythrin
MKKSSIAMVFATALSVVVFQSFTSNTNTKGEIKKNSVSQTVVGDAKTINLQNLQDAFKGESTASAKYAAYSKKAEEEGYHEIAMLFAAASKSEKIHANNHKAVLSESGQKVPEIKPEFTVKSTKENLKDAITGEGYEVSTMYPEFMTNANTAGNQLSLVSLNYAFKTEQKHKVFYEKALAALESKTMKSLSSVYYVCPICGNTYDTTPPSRCGISMTGSEKFVKVDKLNS